MNLNLEWDSTEQAWVAVFVRDGAEWFIDGACVGIGADPQKAVEELIGITAWLVVTGSNFLMGGATLTDTDREWLRRQMAPIDPSAWIRDYFNDAAPLLTLVQP